MTDIAPELIESIKESYHNTIRGSTRISALREAADAGNATYLNAHEYAIETGDALVKAYKLKISGADLPDGRMYYNIAERLINGTMKVPIEGVYDFCGRVQTGINEAAGIGINAVIPGINQDRLDGLIERLSNELNFDDVAWILDDPIKNILQSAIDEFIEANAKLQSDAGLNPQIIRTVAGRACKWCRSVAGVYGYPVENKDVYRRHENCRCAMELVTGKSRQNVWTKIRY